MYYKNTINKNPIHCWSVWLAIGPVKEHDTQDLWQNGQKQEQCCTGSMKIRSILPWSIMLHYKALETKVLLLSLKPDKNYHLNQWTDRILVWEALIILSFEFRSKIMSLLPFCFQEKESKSLQIPHDLCMLPWLEKSDIMPSY